jgi:hypothetical protein
MDYDVVRAYRLVRRAIFDNIFISNEDRLLIIEVIKKDLMKEMLGDFKDYLKSYPEDSD